MSDRKPIQTICPFCLQWGATKPTNVIGHSCERYLDWWMDKKKRREGKQARWMRDRPVSERGTRDR